MRPTTMHLALLAQPWELRVPKPRTIRFPYRIRPREERWIQAAIQPQLRQRRKIRGSRKSPNRPELPGQFMEACDFLPRCKLTQLCRTRPKITCRTWWPIGWRVNASVSVDQHDYAATVRSDGIGQMPSRSNFSSRACRQYATGSSCACAIRLPRRLRAPGEA